MKLIKGIQDGSIGRLALERQLATYIGMREELTKRMAFTSPEGYKSRLRELNLSITFTQLFLDNFKELSKDLEKKADKIV